MVVLGFQQCLAPCLASLTLRLESEDSLSSIHCPPVKQEEKHLQTQKGHKDLAPPRPPGSQET